MRVAHVPSVPQSFKNHLLVFYMFSGKFAPYTIINRSSAGKKGNLVINGLTSIFNMLPHANTDVRRLSGPDIECWSVLNQNHKIHKVQNFGLSRQVKFTRCLESSQVEPIISTGLSWIKAPFISIHHTFGSVKKRFLSSAFALVTTNDNDHSFLNEIIIPFKIEND